ncbi:S-adenosylmethionine:tRNA ribosyltransferase-isomerase [Aquisphaera giovannonii]|uniref:S-adenosylmethionine:tRNA ribosyltransferase-isomerase n=1 Tax=Aquisphaera giovannonii TaxID=406548 RepID=A0A5B9W5G9_9BACT|nr:tRNA preQ1(34) S-adenosylmethionine ribosyltransferase-isomerase QueA [Aquisphaera giovannonii]QEH35848.1 S-adenosylmethionine:tRNA ribosyltransferase-isomerase [Aquisphaera giovannonii]
MLASEFDFDLPVELIAQHPAAAREHSRLMVVRRDGGRIEHRRFDELPALLDGRDILARNCTKVIPARLIGRREATGGKWEGLFLREVEGGAWEILAATRGRPAPGERVVVDHGGGEGLRLALESRGEEGRWIVRPLGPPAASTLALLERHGQIPLPPYIRKGRAGEEDRERYQTVFARAPGSVAAPTAGLHFSDATFRDLAAKGVAWVDLTLHVGVGTFRPIEAERIEDHVMHAEWAELTAEAARALNARRAAGGRVVAVGTTSTRTLETAAAGGEIAPFSGPTGLFIRPGHAFRGLDALVTNFHLPRSSLLVLVSALAGVDLIREAYREAVARRYRFYSYGDAMLIL